MIRFDHVSITYAGAATPAVADASFEIPEGELCLLVGPSGSGKSTVLKAVNGLVPWFTGGTLHGRVEVGGRSTADHPPRELADVVGYVGQVPAADFVTDVVEDELAYTMENLGIDPATMRRRVEEIVDLLGLQDVRRRALSTLSSGEQQRVAIGSALGPHPRVLVLDEPTSALDPGAAEEVLAAVTRLVHDLGLTVFVAEHRLERIVQYADRIAVVDGGELRVGPPATMMVDAPVAPPVVELGRLAGWNPLPLSVRDARAAAAAMRDGLAALPDEPSEVTVGEPRASVEHLVASFGAVPALRDVSLAVGAGEILAVMGRNGAGKSTLLRHLAGLRAPDGGSVRVGGTSPHTLDPRDAVRRVALVPSDPGLLLYASTVAEECTRADQEGHLAPGATAATVARILPALDPDRHPRDLSEGQRLALALGIVLAPGPGLVLLDEPTRGLDYAAKRRLVGVLRDLAAEGHAVVLATHDVELVAEVATRVAVLADGEVVSDGPARQVIAASPLFAPQVAKILAPAPVLTVAEAREAVRA